MTGATQSRDPDRDSRTPRWPRLFWGLVIVAIVVVIVVHALGGGIGGHG